MSTDTQQRYSRFRLDRISEAEQSISLRVAFGTFERINFIDPGNEPGLPWRGSKDWVISEMKSCTGSGDIHGWISASEGMLLSPARRSRVGDAESRPIYCDRASRALFRGCRYFHLIVDLRSRSVSRP